MVETVVKICTIAIACLVGVSCILWLLTVIRFKRCTDEQKVKHGSPDIETKAEEGSCQLHETSIDQLVTIQVEDSGEHK